jgi:uncharacterized repeat protein (TIGR02543 family)
MKKRILALLLTFALVLSIVPQAVFAASGDKAEPQVTEVAADQEAADAAEESSTRDGAKAGSGLTVLAFTSDTHNASGNSAATRLSGWLDKMYGIYGTIDVMGFGGDMASASSYNDTFWTLTQADMDVINDKMTAGKLGGVWYTTGNHEYMNGSYTNGSNTTTQQFKEDMEVANTDTYRMYALGSSGGSSNWNKYMDNQITKLQTYINSVGTDKPIFIITHYPLHWTSSRSITNSGQIISILNAASDAGKKIIFLWGHNHTDANKTNVETHYDEIFAPGESIQYEQGKNAELNFYYAAAGCMSDSDYGAGSGAVKGKGLIVTINSKNQLSFTYYDANAVDVTEEGGTYTEQDPVPVESISINEAVGEGEEKVPAIGEDGEPLTGEDGQPIMVDKTVEAGRSLSLHLTVEPSDATNKTATWSTSDSAVARVSEKGVVRGVSVGTATITATINDTAKRAVVTASIDIAVVPRTSAEQYYVIMINDYALSSNASDQMMSNSSGYEYHGLEAVTYDTDDPAHYSILWTLEEVEGVENGYYIKSYNGEYLSATYVSNGRGSTGTLIVGETQDIWVANSGLDSWQVSGSTLQSTNASSSSKALYLGVTPSNNSIDFFTVRSTSDTSVPRTSVLVEPPEIIEPVAVTGLTLDPTSMEIQVGKSVSITANVLPAGADDKTVVWVSADESIATVSNTGRVRGVAVGTTTITATTNDGGYSATCTVEVTPSSAPGIGYVITIGDYALSTEPASDVLVNSGSGSQRYTYTGLAGVLYNSNTEATEDILWLIEPTDGGYYIMSQDGQYLNATYTANSTGGNDGVLKLDDTPDVWTFEGSLEAWVLSVSKLKSTNADKYLNHEMEDASLNLFDVRSEGNAHSSSMIDPDNPGETRYVETDSLSSGKDYIVAVTKDGTSVYAIENTSGTESGDTGSATLTVTPEMGDEKAYIVTTNTGVVWNYNSNRYLVNSGRYLSRGGSSGAYVPRASGSGSAVTYTSNNKRLSISYSSGWGGGTTYYLTNSNGTFGLNTSTSSAAQVRLFEKQTVFNFKYVVQFVCNGVNYLSGKYAANEVPVYTGTTPTRAETAQYTYEFAGWSADGGTTLYGPDDELPAVTGPVTYVAQFTAVPKAEEYVVSITPAESEVKIGDTIDFMVELGPVAHLGGMLFTVTISDGLQLVSDSCGFEFPEYDGESTTTDPKFTNLDYQIVDNDGVKEIDIIANTYVEDFETTEAIDLFHFKCKVLDTFAGPKTVAVKDGYEFFSIDQIDDEGEYVVYTDSYTINNAVVNEKAKYTVEFKNGTTVLQTGSVYIEDVPAYTGETPTKAADAQYTYTFSGWSSDNGTTVYGPNEALPAVTGEVTYVAQFSTTVNTYTVTFNANGHGTAPAVQTVEYNATATEPTSAPTVEGYTFGGWYTEAACTNAYSFSTPVTAAITLYAKWTATEYSITYNNVDEATMPADAASSYTIEAAVTLPRPTREGYDFGGWFDNAELAGTAVESIPAGSTGNKVFYAKWTAGEYSITYVLGGGTNAEDNPAIYTVETAVTLADPTRVGYTFDGWFDNAEFSGTAVTGIAVGSTGDKTFYAKWTAVEYTISYDLAGGTVATANPTTYTIESDAITLNNPTKDGYVFAGWTGTGLDAATETVTIAKGSTGNRTYTATWTNNSFSVTWKNYDGTVLETDENVEYGTTPVYDGAEPTRPVASPYIYTFAGWNDGTNTYAVGEELPPITEDTTFTAVFTAKEVSRVVGYKVVFEGALRLKADMVLSEEVLNDAGAYVIATYTYADKPTNPVITEKKILIKDAETAVINGTTQYSFDATFYIAQTQDEIKFQLFSGSGDPMPLYNSTLQTDYTNGFTRTPWEYLEALITYYPNSDEGVLAKATKWYSTAAQINFNYKTDLIPEGAVEAMKEAINDSAIATALAGFANSKEGTLPAGIAGASYTVAFEADHSLIYKFNTEAGVDITKYTFKVDGVTVEPVKETETRYSISVKNIPSGRLSTMHTFSVSDGIDTMTYTACALSYANSLVLYGNEKLVNMAKAFYLYSQAAEKYFLHH